MGLDSFLFFETLNDTIFDTKGQLCGGLFSGDGSDGSFRGKVYAGVFEKMTSYSLYEDMTPEKVKHVASTLAANICELKEEYEQKGIELTPETRVSDEDDYEVTFAELCTLSDLFTKAAEKGCQYHAWY